jgi:ABC-type phosphate transport system substrate-binding protein
MAATSTPTRSIDAQAGQAMDPVLPELAEALEGEDIGLDSTVLNSPSALDAYVAGKTDLAFSGRPLSAEQREKLAAAGRPSVMIPIGLSPQALIHKMDVRGVPIQRFRLSVESAAKLYRGLIFSVESPDLRRDNDGCGITRSGKTTDRSVLGFFRTDRSSANYTFSTWLDTAGNDDTGAPRWPPVVEGGALAESPSEFFPNASTGQSKSTNRELAELIKLGTPPGASPPVYTNDSGRLRIGYVDQSAVVELVKKAPPPEKPGLLPIRYVEIRNKAGKWVVPTPAAVRATIAASRTR